VELLTVADRDGVSRFVRVVVLVKSITLWGSLFLIVYLLDFNCRFLQYRVTDKSGMEKHPNTYTGWYELHVDYDFKACVCHVTTTRADRWGST